MFRKNFKLPLFRYTRDTDTKKKTYEAFRVRRRRKSSLQKVCRGNFRINGSRGITTRRTLWNTLYAFCAALLCARNSTAAWPTSRKLRGSVQSAPREGRRGGGKTMNQKERAIDADEGIAWPGSRSSRFRGSETAEPQKCFESTNRRTAHCDGDFSFFTTLFVKFDNICCTGISCVKTTRCTMLSRQSSRLTQLCLSTTTGNTAKAIRDTHESVRFLQF